MEDHEEGAARAAERVRGPAIGLLVTAIVGGVGSLVSLFGHAVGIALPYADYAADEEVPAFVSFAVGTFAAVVGLGVAFLVGFAATRMLRLTAYNLVLVASILAMIPCVSPCCLLGLPLGIWALVVLLDQDVKRAFR